MNWRVIIATQVPDATGKLDPQSVLVVDRDQGALEHVMARVSQRLLSCTDAGFVGVYRI